ncbi:hypothetical protein C8Q77DRAFT_584254 [Trametes polyzona]|nr:hypothetical protein C8Q77DRAFT_584254 [Trametes polyzona]
MYGWGAAAPTFLIIPKLHTHRPVSSSTCIYPSVQCFAYTHARHTHITLFCSTCFLTAHPARPHDIANTSCHTRPGSACSFIDHHHTTAIVHTFLCCLQVHTTRAAADWRLTYSMLACHGHLLGFTYVHQLGLRRLRRARRLFVLTYVLACLLIHSIYRSRKIWILTMFAC